MPSSESPPPGAQFTLNTETAHFCFPADGLGFAAQAGGAVGVGVLPKVPSVHL